MKSMKVTIAALFAVGAAAVTQGQTAQNLIESIVPPGVVFEALVYNKDLPTPAKPKYRSTTDLVPSPDGSRIYICEQTAKRITVFDVKTGTVLPNRILLPNEVTGCAVSKDGATLYATCGSEQWPAGQVCVVNVASGRVTTRIPVGHYPRSPVLSPDGVKLFVGNMFSHTVSVIDVGTQREVDTIHVVREPYALDVTPDGKTLVVGNSLPDDRSTDTLVVSCKISIIDIATHGQTTVRLTRGSHSVFGLTVSADGKYAFATHLIGKFNLIGSTVEKGWLHTNNLAVIDLTTKKFVNDVCLDLALMGMGNPWSVKCTKDGKFMVVSHAGSNDLSIINLPLLMDTVLARSALPADDPLHDLQKDFTTMLDSRKRVQVATKGPRALAIVGNSVFTAGFFDDAKASMEEYEISLSTSRPTSIYTIGEAQAWTGERNGENNFYDASLCFQEWQSCHSCHPLTRPDALNWILGGGAIVAPKNAKSMLYSWWTPPTTWSGRRLHAHQSILAGIELELFRVPTVDLSAPMDTFFMAIKPMASPFLEKGRLSESAKRGKALYTNKEKTDCQKCHPAPLFADEKFYNSGVPDPYDASINWRTPTIVESWRTGPYGHLGSYWGMIEILELKTHTNAVDKLDTDPNGSGHEMKDLISYVLSL